MTALLRACRRFGRMTLATRIAIQNFRIVIKAVSTQGALRGRDHLPFFEKGFFLGNSRLAIPRYGTYFMLSW
jgi:hypothetical protein